VHPQPCEKSMTLADCTYHLTPDSCHSGLLSMPPSCVPPCSDQCQPHQPHVPQDPPVARPLPATVPRAPGHAAAHCQQQRTLWRGGGRAPGRRPHHRCVGQWGHGRCAGLQQQWQYTTLAQPGSSCTCWCYSSKATPGAELSIAAWATVSSSLHFKIAGNALALVGGNLSALPAHRQPTMLTLMCLLLNLQAA
jgi:hypothetical protein